MNKAQVVARVAKETGLTRADVRRVFDAFLDTVVRVAQGRAGEARGLRDVPRHAAPLASRPQSAHGATDADHRPAMAAVLRR
jgi:hypothetical protein